jgi:hypothetical protein
MVVHAGSPSTCEAKVGGLRVQGQPWLHSDSAWATYGASVSKQLQ